MRPLIPYFEVPVFNIPLPAGLPMESIPLHGFGILVAIGFIVGGNVAVKRAARMGGDGDIVSRLIGWLVIGTFIGGHVGYGLMYEPDEYLADPWKFFQVWHGLSSFGGFLVCVPLSIWFFHREKVRVWPYLDCLAFGMAIGWFFGRMGCFVAHDHPGTATRFALGVMCRPVEGATIHLPEWATDTVRYQWGECVGGQPVRSLLDTVPMDYAGNIAVHDTGLYEALFSLALFGLFLALDRAPRFPGFYPLLMGILYAPFRFWLDSMRPETSDGRIFSLTPGQWGCLLMLSVCGYFMYQQWKANKPPMWNPPGFKPEPVPAGAEAAPPDTKK